MTAPVRTMPLNDEILARTPAGRWGQAEEVAGTAVYLASAGGQTFLTTTEWVPGPFPTLFGKGPDDHRPSHHCAFDLSEVR